MEDFFRHLRKYLGRFLFFIGMLKRGAVGKPPVDMLESQFEEWAPGN
jgi:hypothetical protein